MESKPCSELSQTSLAIHKARACHYCLRRRLCCLEVPKLNRRVGSPRPAFACKVRYRASRNGCYLGVPQLVAAGSAAHKGVVCAVSLQNGVGGLESAVGGADLCVPADYGVQSERAACIAPHSEGPGFRIIEHDALLKLIAVLPMSTISNLAPNQQAKQPSD